MSDEAFVREDTRDAGPPPRPSLWLMYLFTQPGRFFAHFTTMTTGFTILYTTWIYGIANVMDRISTNVLKGNLSGRASGLGFVVDSWVTYWAVCIILGIISGAVTYAVGGWWYCMRLRFCGAKDVDASLARRVYIFAGIIWALPTVLVAVRTMQMYSTPLAAEQGDTGWFCTLTPLLALLWSIYVSYRGVRTVFAVTPWKARIWFGMLPMAGVCALISRCRPGDPARCSRNETTR